MGIKANETNCLWSTHPETAKLLKNPERGYEITAGSGKKEIFICDQCGFDQEKIVLNVKRVGFSCSHCSDGISYPEKFFLSVLKQTGIIFEIHKLFKWSNRKIYDFYMKTLNTVVEIHGQQHYEYTGFSRSLIEEQENDKIKKELAMNNGIKNYIVIDARKSELNYLIKSIKESNLKNILDLSKVNWDICNEFASSNLVKTACDLWNKGIRNTTEIGKIMNIHRTTACKYLKKGAESGWCEYVPEDSSKITREKNCKILIEKVSKKIIQLTKDDEIVKEWGSVKEAEVFNKIPSPNIVKVCKGKRNLAGGFKWMYKEDYDQYIKDQNNLHILVD